MTRLGEELVTVGPIMTGSPRRMPRFLVIHPVDQKLFLSVAESDGGQEGGTRIDVIDLSTGQERVLVNTSIGAITALTVDWARDGRVFWADIVNKRIESVLMSGEERQVVVSEGVVEVVGLAVSESWLYWADRDQALIVRVDKVTGTQRQVVLSKVSRLSSLTSLNKLNTDLELDNPCTTGKVCSHFCSYKATAGVSCGCPPGLSLAADNATCGLPPTCQPTEWTCGSRGPGRAGPACIPIQWRCDGQTECADKSDELDCPECGPAQFRCQSGQCVASSALCDGVQDCDDRTDEQQCCLQDQFQCAVTGECVGRDKLCDGQHDCGDSSDELLQKCSKVLAQGEPCCPDPSSTKLEMGAPTATTTTYLIAVFAGVISLVLLSLIVVYCKRKNVPLPPLDNEFTRPLAGAGPSKEQVVAGGVSAGVGGGGGATLDRDRGRAVGGEEDLGPGSSNGLLYDRSHLTGASSTAGTSSSGRAGPPPSPATSVGTKLSRLVPGVPGVPGAKRHPAFNAGIPTGYRYYTHRAAPPCTPCSTDVADESDSLGGHGLAYTAFHHRPHFPSRAGSVAPSRTGYESETWAGEELPSLQERGRYAPPPTTPLYMSDYGEHEVSPPASPNTERSFFLNPGIPGPPPSPVPGPQN